MNLQLKTTFVIAAMMVANSSITVSSVSALEQSSHQGHSHAMPSQAASGPNGGSLRQTSGIQIETVVSQGGIQLFVYDRGGLPVSVDQGRGSASLRVEGYAKRYRYDLLPDGKGGLTAPVNLSKIAGRQIELDVKLVSITGASGLVAFQEVASVPLSETQLVAAAVARQKICPVSGKALGSMGEAIAVDVDGQTVYVCCAGCVNAVKSNPAKYAAGRPQITVTSATAADAALIARQKVCPVMDEPLGGMGNPIKVMVGDKPIFLCCKGCIKKIQAEPAKYLAMVYGDAATPPAGNAVVSNVNFTVTSATRADAALIARQKVCPVMDERLGGMGNPIKVMVGDKPIFLCCRGCIKKLKADPDKYLAMVYGNPAQTQAPSAGTVPVGSEQVRAGVFKVSAADAPYITAQKRCPVMDEPLDAMGGPYKVNAAGKAIYICCPGCAKKIAAQPQKYLDILAKQGVNAPLLQ
jgi:YHS domain-containing protein